MATKPGIRRKGDCMACPLRRQPAFIPKERDEVAFIQDLKVAHRQIKANGEIIRPGQSDAEIMTLFSGWALRFKLLDDGRRQILHFILPGDLIGLQASIMDEAEHGVEALTDVELCVFSRRRIWTIFEKKPDLAFQLTWLGSREESLVDEALVTVGPMNARERIATMVLGLYRRAEQLGLVRDKTMEFPLTRQHIADALGLSLVHTVKTWSALQKLGVFRWRRGHLTLVNPALTERLAALSVSEWKPRPML